MEQAGEAADFAEEVDRKMTEYSNFKSQLDRSLEMKAMNKEEVRERLMMRADMVGQQEELEIIIDELKKCLLPSIGLFDQLDEEYQRYVHARRGYYETARNDIESDLEKRNQKAVTSVISKKRSGDYTVSFSLEGDLRLLHSEFTRSAEALLEQMESESEEGYRMFGEYLEAHEKLRILDEKMFRNIEHVEKDLRIAGDDIQAQIDESRRVLEQSNVVMLLLIEKQDKMDHEKARLNGKSSGESVYMRTSALDYKEYSAERCQLQADLDSFRRQKEALLKRKSCLLDDLAKINEKLKLLAAYHKANEKKKANDYMRNKSGDMHLDDLKLQSDAKDRESAYSANRAYRLAVDLKKRTAIEGSVYSTADCRRDKSPSQINFKEVKSPKTYQSFLDCLENSKNAGETREESASQKRNRHTEQWSNRLLLKNLTGNIRGTAREAMTETVSNTSVRSIDDRHSLSTTLRIDPYSLTQFGRLHAKAIEHRSNASATGDCLVQDMAGIPHRNPSFDQGQLQSFSNTKKLGKRDSSIGNIKANEEYKSLYFTERKASNNLSMRLSRGQTPEMDQTSRFSRVQELLGKLNDHLDDSKTHGVSTKRAKEQPYSPGQALRENLSRIQMHAGGDRHTKANKSMHIPYSSADFTEDTYTHPQKENDIASALTGQQSGSKSRRKKDLHSLINQVANMKKQRTNTETDAHRQQHTVDHNANAVALANASMSHCNDRSLGYVDEALRQHRSYLGPAGPKNQNSKYAGDKTMDAGNRSYITRLDTSTTKSSGGYYTDIKMKDQFILYIKKEKSGRGKWPIFNPFNSNSVTPEMCGYVEANATYREGLLSISTGDEHFSVPVSDIAGVFIPQTTIDYARKRHLSKLH